MLCFANLTAITGVAGITGITGITGVTGVTGVTVFTVILDNKKPRLRHGYLCMSIKISSQTA